MTVAPTQFGVRGASFGESHILPAMRLAIVAGAVAGNVTVTGIKVGDVINEVIFLDPAGGGAGVSTVADLTSEFTITAKDTINNTGGTASTGGQLIVRFFAASDFGGPDLGRN